MSLRVRVWISAAEWMEQEVPLITAAAMRHRHREGTRPSACYHPSDGSSLQGAKYFCKVISDLAVIKEDIPLITDPRLDRQMIDDAHPGAQAWGWLNGLFHDHDAEKEVWAWMAATTARELIADVLSIPATGLGRLELPPMGSFLLVYEVDNWLLIGAA